MKINQLMTNPSAITRELTKAALFLIFASIVGELLQFSEWRSFSREFFPLFDLDEERNIPTFFSVVLMIFAALLLATIAIQQRADASKWCTLALGFLCMSYDEAFQVHETLIHPMRALLNTSSLGIFYYAWVIPGIALIFLLALYFLKFLLRLPAATRFTFLLAAALYIGGCIGFEFVGGWYAESNGTKSLTYNLITTIEESLEICGLIVFIHALLTYLGDNYEDVEFQIIGLEREKNVELVNGEYVHFFSK